MLAVGLVGLVALAATVLTVASGGEDGVPHEEGGRNGDETLAGPHSPLPGALEGQLLVSRGDRCAVQKIDLQSMRIERDGSARGCELWVSPTGELAFSRSVGDARNAAGNAILTVDGDPAQAAYQPTRLGDLQRWLSGPSWNPSGTSVAVCGADGQTLVVDVQSNDTRTVEGCWPTFAPGGAVLSLSDPVLGKRTAPEPSQPIPSLEAGRPLLSTARQAILEDGRLRLDLGDVRSALPSSAGSLGRILGFAADRSGRLAVTVLYVDGLEVRSALQLWDGASLVSTVEIPVLLGGAGLEALTDPARATPVQLLRFSPDGDELAIEIESSVRELLVLDARTGARVLGSTGQLAFDWSPSGDWLGVATSEEIEIYGPDRSRTPTFTLPLTVSALAWLGR